MFLLGVGEWSNASVPVGFADHYFLLPSWLFLTSFLQCLTLIVSMPNLLSSAPKTTQTLVLSCVVCRSDD